MQEPTTSLNLVTAPQVVGYILQHLDTNNTNNTNEGVYIPSNYTSPNANRYRYNVTVTPVDNGFYRELYEPENFSFETNYPAVAVGPVNPGSQWQGTVQSLNSNFSGSGSCGVVDIGSGGYYLQAPGLCYNGQNCTINATLPMTGLDLEGQNLVNLTGQEYMDNSLYSIPFLVNLTDLETGNRSSIVANASFTDRLEGVHQGQLNISLQSPPPPSSEPSIDCPEIMTLDRWRRPSFWDWQEYAVIGGGVALTLGVTVAVGAAIVFAYK